jgi:hypothetical protein
VPHLGLSFFVHFQTKADMSDTDNKSSTVEEAGYAFQPQKLGLRPDFRLTDFTKLKG